MNIELTKEEAQLLVNIINIAVQSKGLEIAEASVFFTKKIQAAFEEKTNEKKQTTPTI